MRKVCDFVVYIVTALTLAVFIMGGYAAATGTIWWLQNDDAILFGGLTSNTTAKFNMGYKSASSVLAITDGTNTMLTITDSGTYATVSFPGGYITASTNSALTMQANNFIAGATTCALVNTTATNIQFGGAATTLIAGATNGTFTIQGDAAIGGGDLTFDDATVGIADGTANTTINFGRNATAIASGTFSGMTIDGDAVFTDATVAIADGTANTTLNFARNAAVTAGGTDKTYTIQGDATVAKRLTIANNASPTALDDGFTLTATVSYQWVTSSTSVTSSTITAVTAGAATGQQLKIENVGAETITFKDAAGTDLGGSDVALGAGDSVQMHWDGTVWRKDYTSDL